MRIAFREALSTSVRPPTVADIDVDTDESGLVLLGAVAELAARRRSVVNAGGREFLVLFGHRSFTVMANRCPHAGTRLDNARIRRRTLTCPMHGLRFALSDGSAVPTVGCRLRSAGPLPMFASRVADGQLYAVVGPTY